MHGGKHRALVALIAAPDGLMATELRDKAKLTNASVSSVLQRLVAGGYVTRLRWLKRKPRYVVTDAGRNAAESLRYWDKAA